VALNSTSRWVALFGFAFHFAQVCALCAQIPQIAHYRFEGDGIDSTGNSAPMNLFNVSFHDGALVLSDGGTNGLYVAHAPIDDFSYESFTVGLDFRSAGVAYPYSTILSGGPLYRWLGLETDADGHLSLTLNNTSFVYPFKNIISTGQWHTVVCTVDWPSRSAFVYLNGKMLPPAALAGTQFEVVGTAFETSDKSFSFWNGGNASHFSGYADNLRVFARALSTAEISDIFAPKVEVLVAGENIGINWSADLTGYWLESNSLVSATNGWVRSPGTPAILGNRKIIIERATADPRYFRLSRRVSE
jgi:hypothetical protein